MGSLSLLQGTFPTQELNQGLWHCRRILYQLSHQGSLGPLCPTFSRPLEAVGTDFFNLQVHPDIKAALTR